MNKKIIIANWKLNGSIQLLQNLLKPISDFVKINHISSKVIIAPPSVYLNQAYNIVLNTNVIIGAQNVDVNSFGAFTGEISVNMLKDINIRYVIVGHSERRLHHQENNTLIAKKFEVVKHAKLIPILCIGETDKDHNLYTTQRVCQKQIDIIFDLLGETAFCNTIIAYEPIWAIGSKKIPSLNYIQDMCCFIKDYILKQQNINKKSFFIQYGGSVNENNIQQLCKIPDVDGFLIGSVSLSLNKFLKILKIISIDK
ncbi:MAG: triose-phosphate isomerase [Buchnera aphidicola (Melaphis rhois)]